MLFSLNFNFSDRKLLYGLTQKHLSVTVKCMPYLNIQEPEKEVGRKKLAMLRMESHSCTGHCLVKVSGVRQRSGENSLTGFTPSIYD